MAVTQFPLLSTGIMFSAASPAAMSTCRSNYGPSKITSSDIHHTDISVKGIVENANATKKYLPSPSSVDDLLNHCHYIVYAFWPIGGGMC
ncbi:hypothetical protein Tco_0134086 [Tanacetum coccineum]